MFFQRKATDPEPIETDKEVVEEIFISPPPTEEVTQEEPTPIPNGTVTTSYLGKPLNEIPYRKPYQP